MRYIIYFILTALALREVSKGLREVEKSEKLSEEDKSRLDKLHLMSSDEMSDEDFEFALSHSALSPVDKNKKRIARRLLMKGIHIDLIPSEYRAAYKVYLQDKEGVEITWQMMNDVDAVVSKVLEFAENK